MRRLARFPRHATGALAGIVLITGACGGGGGGGSSRSAPMVEETLVIENQVQRCTVTRDSLRLATPDGEHRFETLRIESLEDLRTGRSLSLEESPIWRLDLRALAELAPVPGREGWVPWQLVPALNPNENLPDVDGSAAVWVDLSAAPDASVELEPDGTQGLTLSWKKLPVSQWHAGTRGLCDVTVHLRYADADGPLQCSIDVELFRDAIGALDVALLSVAFPDLVLEPLRFGEEPADFPDDVLEIPYEHGFLVPDPIGVLQRARDDEVALDSYQFDLAPGGSYSPQYPGEISAQFLYYYDMDAAADASEPWFYLNNDKIVGLGTRPSVRGGGEGLYLAADDPDLNMKRLIFEPARAAFGQGLRLGVRSFVEFTPERLDQLLGPGLPGDRWQAYYQGPDSLQEHPNQTSGKDLHFPWPAVLELRFGDWVDAAQSYRDFLLAQSKALARDGSGPVPLRELPPEELPPVYRELMGVVGLSEVTAIQPGGAPMPLEQAANVQDYIDWLRADWQTYQDTARFPDAPWYGVIPGEGMVNPDGEAALASGSDTGNNAPRPGLPEFLQMLREPDGTRNWPGRVLAIQSRDSGTWFEGAAGADALVARRETGAPALRTERPDPQPDDLLDSIARPEGRAVQLARTDDALASLALGGPGGPVPVDWYLVNGQWSAAKPDYSQWDPRHRSDPLPAAGVGGGNAWFQGVQENLAALRGSGLSTPNLSPDLLVGTERCNEATLQQNIPHGHRQTFPVAVLEDNGDLDTALIPWAEPVPVTSLLWHDYTLLRGLPYSFSLFYGLPFETVPLGTGDPRYFNQTDELQRARGTQLTRYKLTAETLSAGVIPIVGVELSGQLAFEHEAGQAGLLDSLDDRLSTSMANLATAGVDDVARGGWDEDSAQGALRRLLRARSQWRDFLVWGRRVRDPRLVHPAGEPNWYAEDLQVIRQDTLRSNSYRRFNGGVFSDHNVGGMKIENLVVAAYVDDAAEAPRPRVLMAVANVSRFTLQYQLQYDPSRWGLPAGEIYNVYAVKLDRTPVVGSGTGTVGSGDGPTLLPGDPSIEPGAMQFWLLEIQ